MKTRLLIDTDPGVDDALALMLALSRADVEVLALTIAAGNVGLNHTVANALTLLDVMGADVPVHAGCPTPLVRDAEDASYVHGRDGFGDIERVATARKPSSEHAVDAILRLTREHPGELTLVMLGPLTNLALALRLDPTLPQRVGRLVIMGGAVNGRGNTSIAAEFNIAFDPEAAHIVFSQWPRFELVDWEAVLAHPIAHTLIEQWLAVDTPQAAFYRAISKQTRDWTRARDPLQWHCADPLAIAVAIEPERVTEWHSRAVSIELDGRLTRGATIVDWQRRSGAPEQVNIATRFDLDRFHSLLESTLTIDKRS